MGQGRQLGLRSFAATIATKVVTSLKVGQVGMETGSAESPIRSANLRPVSLADLEVSRS